MRIFARFGATAALLLATLAVAVIPGSSQSARGDFTRIRTLYQEARSLFIEKEYARSNERFREVLTLLPESKAGNAEALAAQVHSDIARNHALLGEKKEAIESLRAAVERGMWESEVIERDESLKSLREEKDFQAIVAKARGYVGKLPFGMRDLAGQEILEKDYAGKVVVIDIWGTWCPPCRMEVPHFVKLQEKYGKDGLAIIGLTFEKAEPTDAIRARVEKFAAENRVNYPLALVTPKFIASISRLVEAFPTTIFIRRDGSVARRVVGAMAFEDMEKIVGPLLAAKPPATGS